MTVCKILNDTIVLQSQNCSIDVYAVKIFMKIITFVNNMTVLDLYPSWQILLIIPGFTIIQNLPDAAKTSFLCVSSLLFELHGAFTGNNEN